MSSHEELVKHIYNSLLNKAKERRLRLKSLDVDRIYTIVRKGKTMTLNMDIALTLESEAFGVLFVFEAKTGSQEQKARKQLLGLKKVLLEFRNRLSAFYSLEYAEVKLYWVSDEQNRIVNVETGDETAYSEFLTDPFDFILR